MKKTIDNMTTEYRRFLHNEEKSAATTNKYIHDVKTFIQWCENRKLTKSLVLLYKSEIIEKYSPASVNSILSSLNNYFAFKGRHDLKTKMLKIQRQIFAKTDRELSREEYMRLLQAAKNKKNRRLYYLMQTVCSTGIRISELRFVTVDAIKKGEAIINCKGKMRVVILPANLCVILRKYIKEEKISEGSIFVTKSGKPLDRSNVFHEMKKLCEIAKVERRKVFPHNLRHLFARTYYSMQKDIVRLADILGHSSINTTRIYTMESGEVHRAHIQMLGLLRC